MNLNLGCGTDFRDGWVNHDKIKHAKHIHPHDLNITPWPWQANSFERIDAISVFEHLQITLIEALDECWRILTPDGLLHIKYPLRTSPFIHDDPTHRWFWSDLVTDFVIKGTKYEKSCPFYTAYKWKLINRNKSERNCWVCLTPEGKK